jgi:hypothetical protein
MPESDIALVANDDMTVTLSGMAALSQNAANSKVKLLTFGDIATAVEFGP